MKPIFCTVVSFFISIFVLIALYGIPSGDAMKCWVCRSDLDPKCSDPFDNTSLPIADCSRYYLDHLPGVPSTMCRKIRQKVYGQWRFIRSCAFVGVPGEGKGDENYCLMRTGSYNVFVETCTCRSKDGCNSGALNVVNKLLLLPAILWIWTNCQR